MDSNESYAPSNPEITLGSTWKHRREHYSATVRCAAKMKDDNDARWKDAVGYTRNGRNGETYVRSETDFLLKFERIES